MLSYFLQIFFFFQRSAGDPFGDSQSAVLVLPHRFDNFFRTRVFFEFWKKYDSNPIKKLGHFCVVTKQKKIEMVVLFQLFVFLVILILIIKESSF
jgi:hypothetical protein